ncbi:MAG: tripartite tricarboxylate transporter substrate binding protein [Bacteroidetes bacterium]|nr:tripartite tricarboxylate transporter substrate binding protein [Bacteroidota bacterium]
MPDPMGLLPLGVVVDVRSLGLWCLSIALLGCPSPTPEHAYPNQPLNLIVQWEDGALGDSAIGIVAGALEVELEQPIAVDNRPGANGVASQIALSQSPSDGYTLGSIGVESTMNHWTGVTPVDVNRFTPIALIAVSPGAITVAKHAPWESMNELISALITDSVSVTASGTYYGGIWDLQRVGLLESVQLDPSAIGWKPSSGSDPALADLLAGEVDMVMTSLSDVDSLRVTHQVRTLAVTSHQRVMSSPEIPTLQELGIDYASVGQWIVLVAPSNLQDAHLERLRVALWNVFQQPDVKASLARTGFYPHYLTGTALTTFLREEDFRNGVLIDKAGLSFQ